MGEDHVDTGLDPAPSALWIRHAESVGTDPDYFTAPGPGLSARGEEQVFALSRSIAGLVGDHRPVEVFSSPMHRARLTANTVAAALGTRVLLDDRLTEHQPGEAWADLCKRTAIFVAALAGGPRSVVVVSHGDPIQAALEAVGIVRWKHQTRFGNVIPPAGIVRTPLVRPDDKAETTARAVSWLRPRCDEELEGEFDDD
jgi:broad specificity phosphatase PhoE